jgi:hypothetical protein
VSRKDIEAKSGVVSATLFELSTLFKLRIFNADDTRQGHGE